MNRKLVVAALVMEGDRLLASQRTSEQSFPGMWELPGGKVEPGEAPPVALRREIREELGCEIVNEKIYDVIHHSYDSFELLMLVYACELATGSEPRSLEVAQFQWKTPGEFAALNLLPADIPLADKLVRQGLPSLRYS